MVIVRNPKLKFIYKFPDFISKLENNLRESLNQNKFCIKCSKLYKDQDRCSTHNIALKTPLLVFVRGINVQYSVSRLLNDNDSTS